MRGVKTEVLLGLGSTVFEGTLNVTPFEVFEAEHLRSRAVERLALLQLFYAGATVIRVVPLK